ncbi:MAG: glycosyltransferase family 2 protein [Bdellovibrionota bacterium]
MARLVSVVVPVFNNEATLEETCSRIIEAHRTGFGHLGLEIVFVNDGSKDRSWDVLLELKSRHPEQLKLIRLTRNFGQLGALLAGFHNAGGDAVICVSADLQDPVSLMSKMVGHWEQGTEIVVAFRQNRRDGVLRTIFSSAAYAVARRAYPELPNGGFDYWLMSRSVCEHLRRFKGRHNFLQGYLLSVGYSQVFIPYTREQRKHGKSGYSFAKKLEILIDFIVDSSYLPIRFMSGLGFLTAFSGVAYSAAITYAWWRHSTPFSGWAPLMILIMLIGGVVMIMLGVIGEYVWRMYDNIRDFPLFIVDETEKLPQRPPLLTPR